MSVFVVDTGSRKNCVSTNYTVIKLLDSLRVKPVMIVKCSSYFMEDVLLPMREETQEITSRDLITKDLIISF